MSHADEVAQRMVLERANPQTIKTMNTIRELIEQKFPDHGISVKQLLNSIWVDGYDTCRREFVEAAKPLQHYPLTVPFGGKPQ